MGGRGEGGREGGGRTGAEHDEEEEADGDGAEGQLVLAPLHGQGSAACEAQPHRPQRRLTRLTQAEVLQELRRRCWAGRVGGGKGGTAMDSSSTRPRLVTLPSFFFAAKLRRRVAAEAVT